MTAMPRIASDITVVVPTMGGPFLTGCLESVAAGSVWPARLVIIDQSGGDGVLEPVVALRERGLEVLHVPAKQAGISAATNRGLEQVRTRFAAVTHDDCRVRCDWLQRLAIRLAEVGDAVLTGRVEPEGNGIVLTGQNRR